MLAICFFDFFGLGRAPAISRGFFGGSFFLSIPLPLKTLVFLIDLVTEFVGMTYSGLDVRLFRGLSVGRRLFDGKRVLLA